MGFVGFAVGPRAAAFLDQLAPGKIRAQITKKAKALITNPFPPGCKKLLGITTEENEPIWRVRSGDYRILYIVRVIGTTTEVLVLDIGHRKDVYK